MQLKVRTELRNKIIILQNKGKKSFLQKNEFRFFLNLLNTSTSESAVGVCHLKILNKNASSCSYSTFTFLRLEQSTVIPRAVKVVLI